MGDGKVCENCMYWCVEWDREACNEFDYRECRASPPISLAYQELGEPVLNNCVFPTTRPHYCCGKFARRVDKPD